MFVGTIKKNVRLTRYISDGLVETGKIKERHDELVLEMERRGMNHSSLMLGFKVDHSEGKVDRANSRTELARRCRACRARQELISNPRSNDWYKKLTQES